MIYNTIIILSLQKKDCMQDWYQLTDFEILAEMGRRFKTARIAKNLTQNIMAERTGLNRSTIRDLECGKPVNLISLIQVFRCLEMLSKLDDLLPGADQSPVFATQNVKRKRVKLAKK
jgi:DNA-binding XRE family transcriptional regulator